MWYLSLYITLTLGHFYFTKLLLPTLIAAAKTSPDGKARVVTTSSTAHLFISGVDFNAIKDGPARKKKTPSTLYAQSKLVCFLSPTSHRYSYCS
jgi:NAD(P)-dependent dehydrogenase (short-subunit alcohol dehydrogenase family)